MRWVTFDCFGTLVDWRTGFATILQPLAGDKLRDLLAAYHRVEPILEAEQPHRLYKDVLASSVMRAAREVALPIAEGEADRLAAQWDRLPVFADVEPMLASLRSAGFRLGVLTNCDVDLFARTQKKFKQPFDTVVTAEEVRSYKPSPVHFQRFRDAERPDAWVHVACSWFHDIAPARDLGIARIWLDRDDTGEDARAASVRLTAADGVAAAVEKLL